MVRIHRNNIQFPMLLLGLDMVCEIVLTLGCAVSIETMTFLSAPWAGWLGVAGGAFVVWGFETEKGSLIPIGFRLMIVAALISDLWLAINGKLDYAIACALIAVSWATRRWIERTLR